MKVFSGPVMAVIVLCALLISLPVQAAKAPRFTIGLEQEGRTVVISDHEAHLKREPFTLVLIFQRPAPPEILVNASYSGESYEAARKGSPFKEITGFTETGMADYGLNPLQWLMISKTAPGYFYYESPCEHRYDLISEGEGKWRCTRTVSAFMERDGDLSTRKIGDSRCSELYLVFAQARWNKDFTNQREFHRDWLKIIFDR